MKLVYIEIENYRSIQKKQILNLDQPLTVIIGPNNEGKSNLLRAIVLAMKMIRFLRMGLPLRLRDKSELRFNFAREDYSWESDFPMQMQSKNPQGETILRLEFRLNDKERDDFKKKCAISNNGVLPVEITLSKEGGSFKVRKPGKGAGSYGDKTPNIARFISENFEFQYIPAIRTEKLSVEVIESLLEREMLALQSNDDYIKALETINTIQQPMYERLGAEIQQYIKKLLPSVKKVTVSQPQGRLREPRYRSSLRTPQLVIDDGISTALGAKGDGIKSLAAISLMRALKTSQETGDLVVAIEEPESHLHPAAVKQLASIIQEMSLEHQVIITTHSPLLAIQGNVSANIIVSKSKASPASSIKAIRESLGVEVADNLSMAEYVILVEGKHDIRLIHSLFNHLSEDFSKLLEKRKVIFDEMNGTGNIGYMIQCLGHSVATPVLLVDADKAGRQSAKKAREDGNLSGKYIFMWNRTTSPETELEDLIDPELYWTALCSGLGANLSRTKFDQSAEKWSDRLKNVYQLAGKHWTSTIESNAKSIIADRVTASPSNAVKNEHQELVNDVLTAILRITVPH
jgi:putative ATP-dependent endonuclease of OLD family